MNSRFELVKFNGKINLIMEDLTQLYKKEQLLLKEYQKSSPELVTPKQNFSYQEILERVGIRIDFGYLPLGYLNLYQQDFIVEEIGPEGEISSIEPENLVPALPFDVELKTLYADLVKVGLSTIEAAKTLAQELGIAENQINYFGLKDKLAITSQKISFRNLDFKKIENLKIPGLFLKNFSWGKGVAQKGKLKGNQFVIVVRTPTTLGEGWLKQSLAKIKDGFYNFYYLQRFGSPRLLSHELGQLILQKNYKQVIKTFITSTGVQDLPLITQLRKKVQENFGDWQKLKEILTELPYTFHLELKLIDYLKSQPQNFLGALKSIPDQATLWIYAYASYLFNLYLSALINDGKDLPRELPLLLHPKATAVEIYQQHLKKDKIFDLPAALKPIFGYSPINFKNTCPTKMPVKIIETKIVKKAVILAFWLPAATYATTFLAHLFALVRGFPWPEWLDKTKYDSKKLLGLGSVAAVEKVLGEYIFNKVEESGTSNE